MLRRKYRGVVMASSSQPRPIQRCPSCGKPIPAYRFKSPYCDHCGWRAAQQRKPLKKADPWARKSQLR
jgi:ribosomal protein L37E